MSNLCHQPLPPLHRRHLGDRRTPGAAWIEPASPGWEEASLPHEEEEEEEEGEGGCSQGIVGVVVCGPARVDQSSKQAPLVYTQPALNLYSLLCLERGGWPGLSSV